MDANKLAKMMKETSEKIEYEKKMKMIAEHNRKLKLGSQALSKEEAEQLMINLATNRLVYPTPSACKRYEDFVYWFNKTNRDGLALFYNPGPECSILGNWYH